MRLTLAAAILAETLPVVLSSSTTDAFSHVITGNSNAEGSSHIKEFLAKKRQSGLVQLNGQNNHPTGDKLKIMNRRRLMNSGDESLVECDPSTGEADVGLLSCGAGRYCLESDESNLGGYCTSAAVSRQLQAEATNNTTLISALYDICNDATDTGCTCGGVDVEAYTGSISCTYAAECLTVTDACRENTTFCYTQTYDLTVTAQYAGSAKSCYLFTDPKEQSYCYSLFIPADGSEEFCEIEVDGTKCNSCLSVEQYYQGSYTDCITFDCSNTNIQASNTFCDYNIPTLQVQNQLLYDALPCENGCNICGAEGSVVINKEADLSINASDTFTYACGVIELAAAAGYFEGTELCLQLAGPVAETCGCTGGPAATAAPFTCDVCPDGTTLTNPTGTLEVPNQGAVTCSELTEAGILSPEECPVVQSLAQEVCGCESPATAEPTVPSTENTVSEVNVNSGSFVPSTALSMIGAMAMAAAVILSA